ncbi:MAG: cupredoxin domain-containing protein [Nitrospira sp.]|nr:cupredoxin domain-containing protein [Nitrospira sp.]MDE0405149.1 cupredoxin domain-containing protein [Nitrospira sp.]MDE0487109.1 cupredoxin domain-containing protein [Nitrospira sp.]
MFVLAACSSEYQDVTIVIDDFRFSPARFDVQAGQPMHLVVRNQGRETHRFQTTFSAQHRVRVVSESGPQAGSLEQGMSLAPGQRLELDLTLPPGVYHFRCPIKGHRGMQGMIVVS